MHAFARLLLQTLAVLALAVYGLGGVAAWPTSFNSNLLLILPHADSLSSCILIVDKGIKSPLASIAACEILLPDSSNIPHFSCIEHTLFIPARLGPAQPGLTF